MGKVIKVESVFLVAMILSLSGVALCCLNAWISWRICGDSLSSKAQRAAQLAFVWFVPLIGALLAAHLLRNEKRGGSGRYPESTDHGYDRDFLVGDYRPDQRASHSDFGSHDHSDVGGGHF